MTPFGREWGEALPEGGEWHCACEVANPEDIECTWYDPDGSRWRLLVIGDRVYTSGVKEGESSPF